MIPVHEKSADSEGYFYIAYKESVCDRLIYTRISGYEAISTTKGLSRFYMDNNVYFTDAFMRMLNAGERREVAIVTYPEYLGIWGNFPEQESITELMRYFLPSK